MESLLSGELIAWLGTHSRWLGLAIFLIALTESLAVAGLVIPGVLLLFAATALAGGGDLSLFGALAWAFSGAVCGDLLSFLWGRWFHQDIRRLGIFARHPQWIDRGEHFFRRYGIYSIMLGRFIGPIRPIIPMIAGMFDMPLWRFLLVNILSALAWAPVYVLPGYLAGSAVRWPVPEFFWQQAAMLGGSLILLGLVLLLLLRAQERWSSLAAAGLCLLAMVFLPLATPWLSVAYGTLGEWLASVHYPRLSALRLWLQPLTGEALLWLLYLPTLGLLAVLRHGWQLLFLLIGAALCLALGLLPGTHSSLLALELALILNVIMLVNRQQSFWLRLSWGLYILPVCALLITAWLVLPLPLPVILSSVFQFACATLLAIWLVERGGPLPALSRPWAVLLPAWPLVAGLLLLLGF
ncbi:DedA family protein [Pseudomonas sp. FME51]|uniref:DedA family protein n=1 Tax=Pseudomonas sp. FME51 TaxID=2742609 RepID=UPI001867A049|nr:DedA family protein [Pseudomonas sp. FME51]